MLNYIYFFQCNPILLVLHCSWIKNTIKNLSGELTVPLLKSNISDSTSAVALIFMSDYLFIFLYFFQGLDTTIIFGGTLIVARSNISIFYGSCYKDNRK